jgi:anti-sigma factor RsiW
MSTASRKMMDECVRFSASMAAYVDGELDAAHAVDMEAHVIACTTCAERVALIRAMRLSMRRTTERCPAALRARMVATVAHEKRRAVVAHGPAEDVSPKLIRLRYAMGLAAAAGVAFAVGATRNAVPGDARPVKVSPADIAQGADEFGIDKLLEELVAMHAHPFRPDTTDLDQLGTFDPALGVRVRRPEFNLFGAQFQGARLHAVSDRGAYLQMQYALPSGKTADGKHITMYAFNPRVVPVQASRLQRRVVYRRPVFVGQLRGYSLAALEEGGVGYAVASDFSPDESTKMVLAALEQQ